MKYSSRKSYNGDCGTRRHRRRVSSARKAELNLSFVRGNQSTGHESFEREMYFAVFND